MNWEEVKSKPDFFRESPMGKEDIVFVVNPTRWNNDMYSIGTLSLSAYLQKKGIESAILDSAVCTEDTIKVKEQIVIDKIREMQPKIICFSATHREFDEVVKINNAIKTIDKNIFTIVGGPQPTFRPEDFLNNGFDFVGVGEGELTLYEFVQEIFNKSYRWQSIHGLCWKDNGKSIFNPPRRLMTCEELNDIPVLPYDKIDPQFFNTRYLVIRGLSIKGAMMMTTRGCPFSCSFCGCGLIFGKQIRYFSLEHIEREVKYLKDKFNIEGIWVADDTFTVNIKRIIGVGRIFKKYNILWGCQLRVDLISEKLVKIMKRLGCVQFDIGAESGSDRILTDIMNKGTNVKQIETAFRIARKHKIRTLANFMIGSPTETYEDLKETERLADKIKADFYIFSIATPLPGTKLYDMVNEKITPQQYSSFDWNRGRFIEKTNKSKLKNLTELRHRLQKKYDLKIRRRRFLTIMVRNPYLALKKVYRYLLVVKRDIFNKTVRKNGNM